MADGSSCKTERAPGEPGPLGLRLQPDVYDRVTAERIDTPSLLLAALSDDECDPVGGILRATADELAVLRSVIRNDDEIEREPYSNRLRGLEDRLRVVAELHRRVIEEVRGRR